MRGKTVDCNRFGRHIVWGFLCFSMGNFKLQCLRVFVLECKHKKVIILGKVRRLCWDGILGELLGWQIKFCFLTQMVGTWMFALQQLIKLIKQYQITINSIIILCTWVRWGKGVTNIHSIFFLVYLPILQRHGN